MTGRPKRSRARLLPIPEADIVAEAEATMKSKKMRGFSLKRIQGINVHFVCDGERACMHCNVHEGNSCYVNFMPGGGDMMYHCTLGRCEDYEDELFGQWEPDRKAIGVADSPPSSLLIFDPDIVHQLNRLAAEQPEHAESFAV